MPLYPADFLPEHSFSDAVAGLENKEVIDYGVRMIGAPLEWSSLEGCTGRGVKVLVIDTGVPQHIDYPVAKGKNFTTEPSMYDEDGHATHVCGIVGARRNGHGVIGVAPDCELYVAKALYGADMLEVMGNVERAIRWGIQERVNIISMSLSFPQQPPTSFHDAIRIADAQGIKIVCTMGNTYQKERRWPAAYPEVIPVAAVNRYKSHAPFSSTGEHTFVSAPGVDVLSCYLGNTYRTMSGTSMAAPMVAGFLAILDQKAKYRQGRYLTPAEAKFLLSIYSEDTGEIGRDEQFGYGFVSFGRIVEATEPKHIEMRQGSRQYTVNGEPREMDTEPIVKDNRTLVPLRFVAEELGARVTWKPDDPTLVVIERG